MFGKIRRHLFLTACAAAAAGWAFRLWSWAVPVPCHIQAYGSCYQPTAKADALWVTALVLWAAAFGLTVAAVVRHFRAQIAGNRAGAR